MPAISQFIDVLGLKIHVSIRGEGSPILLINGLGGLIRTFDPLRAELTGYQTIAFDVPGIGKSQMPPKPMRLPRHADLIAELLDILGLSQVDVFGVSWGGALAQEFALRHPKRVRRLILAATSAGPALFMKPRDILAFIQKGAGRAEPSESHSMRALLYSGARQGMLSMSPRSYSYQALALLGWSSLPRLFRLKPRVLIIAGGKDPLVRMYNARILRAAIRRSELVILPTEGHLFVVTSASEVAGLIRAFLQRADEHEGPIAIEAPARLSLGYDADVEPPHGS